MFRTAIKLIYFIMLSLGMIVSIAVTSGVAGNADVYDTVELKSGEKLTGTVLNDTFTIMTPYTNVALKKAEISEIQIDFEHENHDVITLKAGGLMEGTIEEAALSFKLASGKVVSLEKKQCKYIILKRKSEENQNSPQGS